MKLRLTTADALLIGACVVWGTNFVVVKSALDQFEPLVFNGLRFAAAAAILWWLAWRRDGLATLRPHWKQIVVLGLVGNVAYQVLFIFGLNATRASEASLFTSTTPLWVLVLARLTGHDKLNPRVISGLALATAGVVLLLWESFDGAMGGSEYGVGNLMLLGASASWAIYTVYSQPLLARLQPLALTAATMAAGAIPLLAVAAPGIARMQLGEISTASWGGLAYSILMALVFGYLAWSRGVMEIGSTRTSVYVNLIPVVATITAWVWLGERLSPQQFIGGVAVIAGILLTRRLQARSGQ